MKTDRKIICGSGFCAVTEDGRLVEYISAESDDRSGSVLLGRIDRMMPGMNCAFADIGRKKNGFLPLDEESGSFTGGEIQSGDTLVLQVKKEETGDKGAFLTRDITLPGSTVILMPMNRYIGVSSRVRDEAERKRLKDTGTQIADGRFGLVMRNAAAETDEETIRAETDRLFGIWEDIRRRAAEGGKPGTVFSVNDPLARLKEDYAAGGYETVTVTDGPGDEISM